MAQTHLEGHDPRYEPKSISHSQANRIVEIVWTDGHVSRFPFVWLRHFTFLPSLGRPDQSDDDWCQLPEDPDAAVLGTVTPGEEAIGIHWSHDGSTTRHEFAWLRDNCLSPDARRDRQPEPRLWTGTDAGNFTWFESASLEDPAVRFDLFQHVRDYGLALVRNVPVDPGSVMDLARHFGPARETHHGTLFDIRSLPEDRQGPRVGIGATASNSQAPHTDEGFRHATLGIMLFHCLKPDPSGGGASLFCDGLAAAEALRESDPQAFEFLTTTPLVWAAERNPEERFRTRALAIATDVAGVVRGVRVADRTLPPVDLDEEQVEPAYRALRSFFAELYAPYRMFERVLAPGDMAVFDNQRVLHARRAFDAQAGERHIQQVSIERDEFHNRFRQLAEQVGRHDLSNWEPDAGALCQG